MHIGPWFKAEVSPFYYSIQKRKDSQEFKLVHPNICIFSVLNNSQYINGVYCINNIIIYSFQ